MASREVNVTVPGARLKGNLDIPEEAGGLIVFAHGSGSSRNSPRNQKVAKALRERGMGTLLFDLLTEQEEQEEARTRHLRFNIALLAGRLVGATRWAANEPCWDDLKIGYFGSSTGAAAALVAAAELGELIGAVVSRGGRPDLAGDELERVVSPTLLLIGGNDTPVIPLNEEAYDRLSCERALRIVPGASHLFEEPGKLELVTTIAAQWFSDHLRPLARRS